MKIFDLLNEKKIFDMQYHYKINSNNILRKEFKYQKNLLYQNLKLVVTDLNDEIITTYDDVQPLYLYPLNILDYCSSLKDKKMVMANIYDYDRNCDYFSFILKNHLKSVEFTLTDELDENTILKFDSGDGTAVNVFFVDVVHIEESIEHLKDLLVTK